MNKNLDMYSIVENELFSQIYKLRQKFPNKSINELIHNEKISYSLKEAAKKKIKTKSDPEMAFDVKSLIGMARNIETSIVEPMLENMPENEIKMFEDSHSVGVVYPNPDDHFKSSGTLNFCLDGLSLENVKKVMSKILDFLKTHDIKLLNMNLVKKSDSIMNKNGKPSYIVKFKVKSS